MISVIIPCFNSEKYVSRAIDSVINQTYKYWELILINNNSIDGTENILKTYQLQYPDKIKVLLENKKGAPAVRNRGLFIAKGEWIQFLDADDEILPDKLEGQLTIASNTPAALITSPYTMIGVRNNQISTQSRDLYYKDFWSGLIMSHLGITSANLWKKDTLLTIGGWDESLFASQEYDLMFRVMQISPLIEFDTRNLTCVHILPGESVSRGASKEKRYQILESRINLRLRIKEYLLNNNLLTRKRSSLIDKFIFRQLVKNYRYIPDAVMKKFKVIKLNVPFFYKLKGIYFMRKMDLKHVLTRKGA